MKSLVWKDANLMEMETKVKPNIEDNEVLVKVEAVGICGSEIEGYLGHNSLRVPPLVMGHEFSGTIVEVGKNVNGMQVNERVVINPLISCGKCNSCRKGLENLCDNRQIVGIHRPGAFAEYVAVPDRSIWKIPDHLDFFTASLAEPLACSVRATKRAMAEHPFSNVIIYGAGTIGLLCAFVSQILGASNVIIMDIQEERLNTAKASGIQHALNSNRNNLKEEVKTIVGNKGVDVIIDAAGFIPTRLQAFELINAGGTILNIGLGVDETPLPINVLIRQEYTAKGSFSYTKQDFHEALELLNSGKIKHEQWSEIRRMEEGNEAFQDLVNGRVSKGKIFLEIR